MEVINFQRYYDRLTVNFGVSPTMVWSIKRSNEYGGRINRIFKGRENLIGDINGGDYKKWRGNKNSMIEILELIPKWFI